MDKIFINGKISALDSERNQYEAMAINNGVICALGTTEDIVKLRNDGTEIFDLQWQNVLPGFIDSHMHILDYAKQQSEIDLSKVRSISELIEVLKTYIKSDEKIENKSNKKKETICDVKNNKANCTCLESLEVKDLFCWVIGCNFNQDNFIDKKIPTKEDLNQISISIPIVIFRTCLHIAVLNEKALELLMPEGMLPLIDGGEILLGSDGKPNGIITENALGMVYGLQAKPSLMEIKERIKYVTRELASFGITSVHSEDFGAVAYYEDAIKAYRDLGDEKCLKVRVYQQCLLSKNELIEFVDKGYVAKKWNPFYQLGPLKIISDGSLGARTAYLRSTYKDAPNTRGTFLETKQQLLEKMGYANANGMQIAVHAIGDAAIEEILNCYKELEFGNQRNEKNPLRHGIIHCQITDIELLRRFKELDILAYVQPIFLEYDLHMVEDRVGKELAKTSYAFQTLMKQGVHVTSGSDCPVEHFNVMDNIYCAVARKDLFGLPARGFYIKESLSMEQALHSLTIEGAYASHEEEVKGTLEIGKYADFVVLDSDLLSVSEEDIRKTKVLMTVMNGDITYVNKVKAV